jgi:HAD superfamily hydrolase (TIGR01509 family)
MKDIAIVWDLNGVLFKNFKLDSNTFSIVEELNTRGYCQYICTNTIEWKLKEWIEEYNLIDSFKEIFSVNEMGLLKSNPVVYEIIKEKITENTIYFIDDSETNLEAAKSVGINTILYKSDIQLKEDFKLLKILNDREE